MRAVDDRSDFGIICLRSNIVQHHQQPTAGIVVKLLSVHTVNNDSGRCSVTLSRFDLFQSLVVFNGRKL